MFNMWKSERGQSLIEFGLLMPILIVLILTCISVIQHYYIQHTVQQSLFQAGREITSKSYQNQGEVNARIPMDAKKAFRNYMKQNYVFSLSEQQLNYVDVTVNGSREKVETNCIIRESKSTGIVWKKGQPLRFQAKYCYAPIFSWQSRGPLGAEVDSSLTIGVENISEFKE